ncbi:type 1 glutamine amidotransferase domain-containing protein [Enemella sp. A6]|uniref:type 1 glutamine amidotransferase domain-containing protein n=1 Tax=Enemella sp. A6 TaxID=3440152 RepID=UPI003EBF939D
MNDSQQVAFLVAHEGIEEIELTDPWEAVRDAGYTPRLLSPKAGEVQAYNHLDKSNTYPVDAEVGGASVDDYAALVLPGGVANPDALRTDADAVRFIADFVASGKPVAAICHAPWVLAEAEVLRGRTVTAYPSVRTDLRNAGAEVVDERVVVDGNLITSRNPDDLPAFNGALLEALNHGSAANPETAG